MPLQLITPPALEPVTLDAAKAHLKLDTDDDDTLVTTLITAARARAEWHTGRALVTQSWILWRDCWTELVEIPLPPLQSVGGVTVYHADDTSGAFTDYKLDAVSQPGRIALGCAPSDLRRRNAVAIAFTAGYGAAASDVPADIRAAILETVADLYVHRGDGPETQPQTAQALLAPYRIFKL